PGNLAPPDLGRSVRRGERAARRATRICKRTRSQNGQGRQDRPGGRHARLTGARVRYTFVTKAPFVTTEGNTNVSEGSATAFRYPCRRQARAVRVGGRAGGH